MGLALLREGPVHAPFDSFVEDGTQILIFPRHSMYAIYAYIGVV